MITRRNDRQKPADRPNRTDQTPKPPPRPETPRKTESRSAHPAQRLPRPRSLARCLPQPSRARWAVGQCTAKLPNERRGRVTENHSERQCSHQTAQYIRHMQVCAGHHSVPNGRKSPGEVRQRVGILTLGNSNQPINDCPAIGSAKSQMLILFRRSLTTPVLGWEGMM